MTRVGIRSVLRDVTERVIIASKGRFDRAVRPADRRKRGLPHQSTVATDDFLGLTLDVWPLPPESARRVGHPAPFPVALPEQLIRLYTFDNDLVLDPLMGSGSTLVAASRLGRRFVGYDTDSAFVDIARARVAAEGAPDPGPAPRAPSARQLADDAITHAGFALPTKARQRRASSAALAADLVAIDASGRPWAFEVAGLHSAVRPGLTRMDLVWKHLGRAAALRGSAPQTPLILLTPALPPARSSADRALRAAGPSLIHDVVDLLDSAATRRLAAHAAGDGSPLPGFWSDAELAGRAR